MNQHLTRQKALGDLNLPSNATDDEIKAAYRTLSMKYHPDRKGGDEEKFKAVNAANRLLTSPSSKDGGFYTRKPASSDRWDPRAEYFRSMFKAERDSQKDNTKSGEYEGEDWSSAWATNYSRSKHMTSTIVISLKDAFFGVNKIVKFAEDGGKEHNIYIPPGVVDGGTVGTVSWDTGNGKQEVSIIVRINSPSQQIIWAEQPNLYGGGCDGAGNITTDLAVDWTLIMFGGRVIVTTCNGTEISIHIPAGILPGSKMKATGHGYWKDSHRDKRGDALFRVTVPVIPKAHDMSIEELTALKEKIELAISLKK